MSNRKNLSQASDEILAYLDQNPTDRGKGGGKGGGHDVSNEPRVPKGKTDGGEWTTGGANGAPSDHQAGSQCPNGYDIVQMEVTAYTSGVESTGKNPSDPNYGKTANPKNKKKAGPGTIAAPPGYDFGTRMYVPGYGWGDCARSWRRDSGKSSGCLVRESRRRKAMGSQEGECRRLQR